MDVINDAATVELATLGGLEAVDLTSDLADAKTAITVIAQAIDAVTDFEDLRDDADGVLYNKPLNAGSFGALVPLHLMMQAAAVANNAPADIDITDIAFTSAAGDDGEFSSSLVFTLSGTDADAGADGALTFSLSGADAALFQEVDGEPTKRKLDFNSAAVIEALEENPNKKEFSFNVIATDGGTIAKSYSEAFSFVDAGTIVEDSGKYDATGTVSTHGLEGSDVSFSISGMSDEGVIAGTYGSITLNSETGAYTYTADNTLAENQGLQNGEENIDFFTVAGTDGTKNNTTFLSFTISGVTEPLSLTPPTNDALVEGAAENTAAGSLATGADGLVDGESTATYGIDGVTASEGAAVKSGTYGSLSVDTATGAYTYTLDSNAADTGNATLRALSGADLVSDNFLVTLDDGLGGSASATISFPVQGYGIKIDDVASDNVINKAEADEGITITGTTNPNQEITLTFNSETDLAGGTNATSDADANWSIDVTAADVAGMGEGAETLTASMTLQETVNVVVKK